jgi:hypothetical protein
MSFPATFNISLYSGDTYEFVISPKNSDGTPFDLSTFTATMTIATTRGSSPSFSTNAQAVVNTTLNTVTCTILPGVNNSLNPAITYVYDVEIRSGTTRVYTLLTGNITITEDVTP